MTFLDDLKKIATDSTVKVEVIPDDATSFPGLTDEMVAGIELDDVVIAKHTKVVYMRKTMWDKMKPVFPTVHTIQ